MASLEVFTKTNYYMKIIVYIIELVPKVGENINIKIILCINGNKNLEK